ncbi:MAG: hypothetical protein MZV65_15730 [Chromatiales bacterium]|nr:hypothetical protein [Chromatiales bacterium]
MNLHLRSLVREILERATPVGCRATGAAGPASRCRSTSAVGPARRGSPLWPKSPFPGLRAFTPEDAPIFFGRGQETDDLVGRAGPIPARRFLAVVGASGSGKSSLVAAGLIPRLLAGAIPGSRDWVWVKFTPGEVGDNPLHGAGRGVQGQPCNSTVGHRASWADRLATDSRECCRFRL